MKELTNHLTSVNGGNHNSVCAESTPDASVIIGASIAIIMLLAYCQFFDTPYYKTSRF